MKNVEDNHRARALLVAIKTQDTTDAENEESLKELERLVTTLGLQVVGYESQKRPSTRGTTVVGEGKLEELKQYTIPDHENAREEQVDTVIFDCELTPSQSKNLETALQAEVMDRTGVIIEIFSRHAKTRAARLQVEIAQLNYMAPRLRETGGGNKERQAGRGAGETQIELDRRRIRDRITELKRELEGVQREQEGRRVSRAEQGLVALVGYTNAGKSSTMRALTGSDVLVENKLFATLDTTVRAMQPETHPRILVSDTVGFIKKLPHDLVASFKSTLDEALNATLLLFVVDAADPSFRSQLQVSKEVLGEVGASEIENLLVLNKADQLSDSQRTALAEEFPTAIFSSTRNPDDIKKLREKIISYFEKDMVEEELFVPYTAKGVVGEIRTNMRVLSETFEYDGVRVKVRSGTVELGRLKKKLHLSDSN